jgi:cytochrome c oxidase subunit 4
MASPTTTNPVTTKKPAAAYVPKFAKEPEVSSEQPLHPTVSMRTYVIVFVMLLVLLVVTVVAAFVDLGPLNIFVALGIASVKALLVILYFMHVLDSSRLTKLFVTGTFIWLAIMFILTFSDYVTRGWTPISKGWDDQVKEITEGGARARSMEIDRSTDEGLGDGGDARAGKEHE